MAEPRRLIYWDTDVWLSFLEGGADRLPILDALITRARTESSVNSGDLSTLDF